MHRSHGLQGSLKRRYKHPSPTSINGYHTAKKLLSQSPAKRPTFAFTGESGYTHSAFRERSHTTAHTPKEGAFRMGRYHYPRSVSHVSETLRGQVSERQTLPLLGLGRGYSRRTQRACGTAMRLCASLSRRRRGPAGLRDLFCFCRNCGLYALFQILLSVFQTLQLVLFLCKPYLSSFLFGSELFKGFRFCHCA